MNTLRPTAANESGIQATHLGNAGNRKWGKSVCFVCGDSISTCGLGYVSHMRKHVRQGKVKEYWAEDGKHREFEWSSTWANPPRNPWAAKDRIKEQILEDIQTESDNELRSELSQERGLSPNGGNSSLVRDEKKKT